MIHPSSFLRLLPPFMIFATSLTAAPGADAGLRIGMIGLDTSHAVAFTKMLNDPKASNHLSGATVVAAFRSGSPDMQKASIDRIAGFAKDLSEKYGVKLCDSIEEVLGQVDCVMIENVDGRKHLEIARIVFPTGKPVFIDKPLAGTLGQGLEIVALAKKYNVPFFSASSLRYAESVTKLSPDTRAAIRALTSQSPCTLEPHHPDLFWYGVHGVEILYAILGTGCQTVVRTHAPDVDVVTGRWADGRVATFQGYRDANAGYGFKALLKTGVINDDLKADYAPLVREIVSFFQTRKAPVSHDEMIEVLAFMEAADESKRQGGSPVSISDVLRMHGAKR
ncbi:MAG: Gfo/Idh/MocA family oxidoreductase [Opitutaceae bacterium]|nr:Gfo/Idh/MocA family oxidoreductase [Opitutaceae bacterium]